MRLTGLAAGALLAMAASDPARATVYLREQGEQAFLSGEFERGDEKIVAAFLAQPRAVKLRVVNLDSFGGHIGAGIAIGRLIRKARLATAVDAARARCDSACTLIFAGGVQRYYLNGNDVFEGTSGRGGLGFHPSHSRDGSWTRILYSDLGTNMMANFYREMGQPGAAELMKRAGYTSIFRPNGTTALRLRIATSVGPSPD
jgi:hypothetical protein